LREKISEQNPAMTMEQVSQSVAILVVTIYELVLKMEYYLTKDDNLAAIRIANQIKAVLFQKENPFSNKIKTIAEREFNEWLKTQPKG
jgi:hypothetical protein